MCNIELLSPEIEYWQESESEVKSFLDDTDGPELPATLSPAKAEKTPTQQMEDETVLWIVLFTCVFQVIKIYLMHMSCRK